MINEPNLGSLTFLFNAHTLNSNSSVKDEKLYDNCIIQVIKKNQVRGGY